MDMDERRGSSCSRTGRACERARRSASGQEPHRRQSQVSVSEREKETEGFLQVGMLDETIRARNVTCDYEIADAALPCEIPFVLA